MRYLTKIVLVFGITIMNQPDKPLAESAEVNPHSLSEECTLNESWRELQGKTVAFEDVCLIKFIDDSENTTLWYHPSDLAKNSPVLLSISESPTFSGLRLAFIPNQINEEDSHNTVMLDDDVFAWHEGMKKAKKIENVSFDETGIGVKFTTFADVELLKELASVEETAYVQFGWNAVKLPEETKTSIIEILKVWESEYQPKLTQ